MNRTTFILFFACGLLAVVFFGLLELSLYLRNQQDAPLSKAPEHGTEFIVEADLSQSPGMTNLVPVEKALDKRFSHLGLRAFVEPTSASRLRIVLPATESNDVDSVHQTITRRGFLEFRLVSDQSDDIIQKNEPIPAGYEMMQSLQMVPGQQSHERLVVSTQTADGLAGNLVQSAYVAPDNLGNPQICFQLTPDAATRFGQVTTQYAPDKTTGAAHRLAIIMDGGLYSAPRILDPITGGSCMMAGNFTDAEAYHLAQVLNSPLPVPLTIVQTNSF